MGVVLFVLLKFAYQDYLSDRKFNNTTEANIKNYEMLLGEFIEYCIENQVLNVEDVSQIHIKQYLMECKERGNTAETISTKLLWMRAFLKFYINFIDNY